MTTGPLHNRLELPPITQESGATRIPFRCLVTNLGTNISTNQVPQSPTPSQSLPQTLPPTLSKISNYSLSHTVPQTPSEILTRTLFCATAQNTSQICPKCRNLGPITVTNPIPKPVLHTIQHPISNPATNTVSATHFCSAPFAKTQAKLILLHYPQSHRFRNCGPMPLPKGYPRRLSVSLNCSEPWAQHRPQPHAQPCPKPFAPPLLNPSSSTVPNIIPAVPKH